MSSFTDPLTVTDLNNGTFRTEREFTYYVKEEGSDDKIVVPAGFVFDCFSVPKCFQWLFPRVQKKGNQAAALHDWLYGYEPERSRKECDAIFKEALKVLGVPLLSRAVMYRALRWFGVRKLRVSVPA